MVINYKEIEFNFLKDLNKYSILMLFKILMYCENNYSSKNYSIVKS